MAVYDVHMPNMMLPATQTSCLKYIYTNFQVYIGFWYVILWRLPDLVCQKMMLPATKGSCLKYIHTNISLNVGTGTRYIDTLIFSYPKTSAASDKTYRC